MAGGPSAAARVQVPNASAAYDGLMSAADKVKLDGLTGAAASYANLAAFPAAAASQGLFAIANDTAELYIANNGSWWPIVRVG